eukprot:Gb_41132 [translate_table: standard]
MKCLDKAATITDEDKKGGFSNPWRICTLTQVEELKILVRMFPIWATGIVFSAVYAQLSTMFVEQGMTLDTSIVVRKYTGKERGFTELQRMVTPVPMSIFWQVPQNFFEGAAEVFTVIGQLEIFYDQSPDAMRSLCSALALLTTALETI